MGIQPPRLIPQPPAPTLRQRIRKQYRWPLVPTFLGITAMLAGFFVGLSFLATTPSGMENINGQSPESVTLRRTAGNRQVRGVDFSEFWQVWDYIKDSYVHSTVTDAQLFYGALHGMVESLDDPYSIFMEPTSSQQFRQDLSGSFDGIGAEVGMRNDRVTIIAPLPGNPAFRAGLKAGDVVIAIDDASTATMSLDVAVSKIRGRKGTAVTLKIMRNGETASRTFQVVRDTISIVSVTWQALEGRIVHLQLKYFNEDTLGRFDRAVREIVATKPKGIIFDLRNNPGGFLTTAIEVTSYWTGSDRVVVAEQQRDGNPVGHRPQNRQALLEGIPTVVLINRGSASGSEIVAGALQDYELATLVGETSFGKGSVQDLKEFDDGSSVKLTIAKWLTPAGRIIEGEGIVPDVTVKPVENGSESRLDPQLEKAIEIVQRPVKPAAGVPVPPPIP